MGDLRIPVKWGVEGHVGARTYHALGAGAIGGSICDSRKALVECKGRPRLEECCEECWRRLRRWSGVHAEELNVPLAGQPSTVFVVDLNAAPYKVRLRGPKGTIER